jgi:hypothetical protein
MNYEDEMNELLKANMSEDGFRLWTAMLTKITSIWERPTSSTGKYHNKDDGRVPTVIEHTYEMLYAATKVMRMYGAEPKSVDADIICLAIALHDAWKYGEQPKKRSHTASAHDLIAAQKLRKNRAIILQLYSDDYYDILEDCIRLHQGRWSTDVKNADDFNFSDYHPYVHFIHMLDMLSANNRLHHLTPELKEYFKSKREQSPTDQPHIKDLEHISQINTPQEQNTNIASNTKPQEDLDLPTI